MTTICYDQHQAWKNAGLMDYGDFADCVEYVNQSEYGDGQLEGEWYWIDYENFVIYHGSFGNYNSPGADAFTKADVYDQESGSDGTDFITAAAEWEGKPEYGSTEPADVEPAETVCEGCKSTDNHVERIQDDNDQWWECIVCDHCKRTLTQKEITWTP